VVASDPVTLSAEPGSYAVQVNANDIAVMGAEPRWLLASVLLPRGSEEGMARSVMAGLTGGCGALGVALVGGHTEVTPAVTRPVVAATMIGLVAPDELVTSSGDSLATGWCLPGRWPWRALPSWRRTLGRRCESAGLGRMCWGARGIC
jgi:hydrogenase maturation factor